MSGRIRSIKPEWLEDELLAAASDEARALSIGLILMADDYGNGRASIATIAASVWRYALERDDGAHAPEVIAKATRAFRELLAIGFLGVWSEAGQRYFAIRNWVRHQRVDKPGKALVPTRPKDLFVITNIDRAEDSRTARESISSGSRTIREPFAPDLRPTTYDQEGNGSMGVAPAGHPESGLQLVAKPVPAASAAKTKKPLRVRRFPNFVPKPEHVSLAMQIGADIEAEAQLFRDHEYKDPKSDEDACFRTWLKNSIEFKRKAIGARLTGTRAADGLDRQLARVRELEAAERLGGAQEPLLLTVGGEDCS